MGASAATAVRVISLAIVYLATCSFLLQPCNAQFLSGSGDESQPPPTTREPDGVPLNFIFLSSDNERIKTSGSIPAVDIALDLINGKSGKSPPFLGKYVLGYHEALDSQCERTRALDEFHGVVHAKGDDFVQNIAIIGAGCSIATFPIAEISHYYNIPMISWSSSAAELSDRHKYRNYFRPVPSEEIHSPGLAALLQTYGWRQLAFLTQTEALFLHTQKVVIDLLNGVDIVLRQFGTLENPLKVDDLFVTSQDMRIFVLNMYVDHAKHILCEAYKRGMYYPRYLWITPGWYGNDWWTKDPVVCPLEEMETVLSNSLSAVQYPIFSETEVSDLGLSTMQFRLLYGYTLQLEAAMNRTYTVDLTAPLAFDAVWTLAIALKRTIGKIESGVEGNCVNKSGTLVPLEHFDYGNEKLGCLLKESLQETFFLGISGNVTFDESGDRVGNTVRISQYQRGAGFGGGMGTPFIGYAYVEKEGEDITGLRVEFASDNMTIFWPEGVPPDGIPKQVIVSTALALTVIYYILAIAGIIFALVCVGFNIIFRNRKIVKVTSPNLNYLIILGAVLLYVSVFFWVSPAREKEMATLLCNFRVWLFSLGNTLCLAVVLSKMWRIHYIFTAPSPKRKPKPPQDWHLLIIISVMLSIDLIILLVPTAINSARLRGELAESVEHGTTKDELDVVEQHSFYRCYSDSQVIWLFMSYIYKFLLQIAAIYFAFMSRKIRVKALNDSKQIAAIIYVTSLLLVISAFGFWIGLLYLNTSTAVFAAAQLVTATVFLGLLFIPKMIGLWLDPTGQNIFGARNYTTTSSTNPGTMDEASQAKLLEMTERVKELESELEKYQSGSPSTTPQYTFNTTTPTETSPDIKLVKF